MFGFATGQWNAPNVWILPRFCTRANRVRVHFTSTFNLVHTVKRCMRLCTPMLAKTSSTTPALRAAQVSPVAWHRSASPWYLTGHSPEWQVMISTALLDLLVPHPLTLLLIAGRRVPENNLFGALSFCHGRGDNFLFDTFLSKTLNECRYFNTVFQPF
jgi:hypothetical protein